MEKTVTCRHQVLLVLVTLLAFTAAEYRPRPGPPPPRHGVHGVHGAHGAVGGHIRGPPPNKGYSSPAKIHHDHRFQENSYSSPSYPKGSQFNRPMRYRKPGPSSPMARPGWESSSYKISGLDRYKSPVHFSSGEPPSGLSSSSSSVSSSGYLGFPGGLESSSSAMDLKHLNDLSPIRTIPAPNLGPSSWPAATHLGMTRLASQLASQSPAVFPSSLDMTDAAALLASSNQHGYQVSEPAAAYATDSRPSLLRTGLDAKDLSLRLSPYTAMPQLMNQRYSPLSSLSSQDLFHLLNGFPLQEGAHTYLQPAQSAVTDAAQLQAQLHQAQLQQAQLQQLQQAQLQQAQLQQAQLQQAQVQQAQLEHSQLGSTPSSLRFSFDDQNEQLLQSGRRGQLPQELDGADSSPVVRLYGNRHPSNHEDPEVDGSEPSGISVSPSSSPSHDEDDYDGHHDQQQGNIDAPASSNDDFNEATSDHEEHEDERPTRIRTRKNRDRVPSS